MSKANPESASAAKQDALETCTQAKRSEQDGDSG